MPSIKKSCLAVIDEGLDLYLVAFEVFAFAAKPFMLGSTVDAGNGSKLAVATSGIDMLGLESGAAVVVVPRSAVAEIWGTEMSALHIATHKLSQSMQGLEHIMGPQSKRNSL